MTIQNLNETKFHRQECDVVIHFLFNGFNISFQETIFENVRIRARQEKEENCQRRAFTIDPSPAVVVVAAAAVVVVVDAETPIRLWGIGWRNVLVRRICSK